MTTASSTYTPVIQDATWPKSCPAEAFLSVVAGNTHCKFAYHEGHDFQPTSFWRIPIAANNKDSFIESLPHQSPAAQALWKHPNDPLHRQHMYQYRVSTKRHPLVNIYIISTNPAAEQALCHWFEGLPVQLLRLSSIDTLPYPTFGMDRQVAAWGVPVRPALIIDGGTALTTTVIQQDGTIRGGTISPGLDLQCRSLHMGQLPLLTHHDLMLFTQRTEPLSWCANNTQDAMWNGIVRGVALYVQAAVQAFVKQFSLTTTTTTTGVHIFVTGSDGPLLMELLHPQQCRRLLADMPSDAETTTTTTTTTTAPPMEHAPHLLHQGIANFLLQHKSTTPMEWVGLRVARKMGRGFVECVEQSSSGLEQAIFYILYDNGNDEALGVLALYDALTRYSEIGESSGITLKLDPQAVEQRKKDSQLAAEQLVERCPSVAEHQERLAKGPPSNVYSPLQKIATQSTVDTPLLTERSSDASPRKQRGRPKKVATNDGSRKRGRPKKIATNDESPPRKRGRPKKSDTTPPPSADRRTKKNRNQLPPGVQPTDYLQRRIAKFFGDEETPFLGTVVSYEDELWKIQYDDGDEEEMEFHELAVQLKCFEENQE